MPNVPLIPHMQRPIKFRAWDREAELWRYFTLEDAIAGKLTPFARCLENKSEYIGRKDKNGIEIWERDVVRQWNALSGSYNYEVAFTQWDDSDYMMTIAGFPIQRPIGEVIGNVCENPELLK